jgi:hypothetical protein
MRSAAQSAQPEIRYTTEALKATIERLESEYSVYQEKRDRDAVFGYLSAVFETVAWWHHVGRAREFAQRALRLRRPPAPKIVDPFAAIIFCTSDSEKVDFKTRSKWARVLRYAKVFKDPDEPLPDFVKVRGGINKCARRYSRRLGRTRSP